MMRGMNKRETSVCSGFEKKERNGQGKKQGSRRRKSREAFLYFVLAGLLLLADFWILYRSAGLQEERDLISLSYPAGAVAASSFEQMLKTEESEMFSEAAVWKDLGKGRVSVEGSGRELKVSCYQIKGQPGAVFGKGLLSGRYFTEGEKNVCLLDLRSARQLFGSEDVLGLEVRLEGSVYQIAGILAENTPVCVIPAEGAEEISFDGVAVRKWDAGQSSKLAVNVLEVNLGSTDGQIVDGQLYCVTAWLFYALVNAVLLVLAGVAGKRRMLNHTEGRIIKGICRSIVPVCLILAVFIVIAGIYAANPGSDYLPSYWADFEFFGQLFREKTAQIQSLVRYQEFSSWGNILKVWQQLIGTEIFLAAAGLIVIVNAAILCREFNIKELN